MIGNAHDIAAQYLLKEAHYIGGDDLDNINNSTMISLNNNKDESQTLINKSTIGSVMTYNNDTLIQHDSYVIDRESNFIIILTF